jgi:signal transduction histidine kinase
MASRFRQRWDDLPLRAKGLVVAAPPVLAFLISAGVFALTAVRARTAQGWVVHTLEVKAQIATVSGLTVDIESAVRAFIFQRTPEALRRYDAGTAAMPGASRKLHDMVADDPEQLENLRQISVLASPRALTRLLARARQAPIAPDDPLVTESELNVDGMRRGLAAMQQVEDRLLAQRVAAMRRAEDRLTTVSIIATVAGLAGGMFGAFAFTTGITWRIQRVRQSAANIAHGLPPLPLIPSNDEIGGLHREVHNTSVLLTARAEEVARQVEELGALNKELEAFTYSVSHDLRAPLRHVTGFASLLESSAGPKLDERDRRYLHTLSDAARRMGRLIDDLLAFSRMGRASLERRTVSLEVIVREVRSDLEIPEGKDVIWNIQPLPDVDADPAMLRLVFTNLLSNAVKYSSTRTRPQIDIGVCASDPTEAVVFVRDNGVGFDMQYVHKLFGVFQRLHSAEEFEGTGIGLANVRRIVSRHGGRAWATGAVDGGATFYVALPCARREAA